ncbi:MAG: OmpA family protein [Ignavibacteriales bacterium]|nr:MAG: OmpA family protein [Ignavibacteriales bacterium]
MNRIILTKLIAVIVFLSPFTVQAQLDLNKMVKKTKKKVEKRIESNVDKKVDKTLDSVEEELENNDAKEKKQSESSKTTNNEAEQIKSAEELSNSVPDERQSRAYSKFDFIPGDNVIFEDDLKGEQNGEFPSKWDLVKGTIENGVYENENVIWFRKNNSIIKPLICNNKLLPEVFTIEFDYFMGNKTQQSYSLWLMNEKNKAIVRITFNGKEMKIMGKTEGSIAEKYEDGWKHISVSFNRRALKVYHNAERVLNIPNIDEQPVSFQIEGGRNNNPQKDERAFIKNIRIAEGGVPLYNRVLTEGKIVTTGIKFDVNKATIKPESMGVINDIFNLLKENADLKFSVEGHTDSDGNEEFNLKLSEERAVAVVNKLVEMGVSASRLKAKGWGESKPLVENSTPEGKANNRRVEFIKF